MGPVELIARSPEELLVAQGPQKSLTGVVKTGDRWGNGVVPYVIDAGFLNPQRVSDAIAKIRSDAGGISFQTKGSWDADYLRFRRTTDTTSCGNTSAGKGSGAHDVLISDGCGKGTVIHEILHALGFYHEQSRCDRDSFVQILTGNIQPGREGQFTKLCLIGVEDLEAYDERSIMHYRSNAFGKIVNGQQLQTIHSLRGLDGVMGQDSLSTIDVFTTDDMYKPYGPFIYQQTNQGGHPLVVWAHSGRAVGYTIALVRVYEEWDDYSGIYTSYEEYLPIGGGTSSLSWVDTQSTFTGNSLCQLWRDINGSADYRYYYELTASFANGVVSTPSRGEAMVTPLGPPCP